MFFNKKENHIGDVNVTSTAESPAIQLKEKNNSTRMLLAAFIAFICITLLPLFTLPNFGDVSLNATDVMKVSIMGMEIPECGEGDLVNYMGNKLNEILAEIEDPEFSALFIQIGNTIMNYTASAEPALIATISKIKLISTGLLAASALVAVGFLVMIFAAVKNKKKLYLLSNLAIIAVLLAAIMAAIALTSFGAGIIGIGIWVTIIILAINCYLTIKK